MCGRQLAKELIFNVSISPQARNDFTHPGFAVKTTDLQLALSARSFVGFVQTSLVWYVYAFRRSVRFGVEQLELPVTSGCMFYWTNVDVPLMRAERHR